MTKEKHFDLVTWAEQLDAAITSAEDAVELDPATAAAVERIKKQQQAKSDHLR